MHALSKLIGRSRKPDSGFTLIELLVVIIILGILAAVVVFAVGGVGDKGQSSARAIDVRTIRTAQEAHCASFGRYATEEELVANGFLSSSSSYHESGPSPLGTPGASGNCTGSGNQSVASYVTTCEVSQSSCGQGGALRMAWETQVSPTTDELFDVSFGNAQRGWAVGSNRRIVTTSNGTDWSVQAGPEGGGPPLFGVDAVDGDHAWLVGINAIWRTVNGAPWESLPIPVDAGFLWDVDFINTMEGWAVGNSGRVIHTDDGGLSWQKQAGPGTVNDVTPARLQGVSFVNENDGWAVGIDPFFSGAPNVLKTTDGGATWIPQVVGTDVGFNGVKFFDSNIGWATGGIRAIWKTVDGGSTWEEAPSVPSDRGTVDFVSTMHGWAGQSGGDMLVTNDGGVTWNTQSMPGVTGNMRVDFVDLAHGWAVGSSGRIFAYKAA